MILEPQYQALQVVRNKILETLESSQILEESKSVVAVGYGDSTVKCEQLFEVDVPVIFITDIDDVLKNNDLIEALDKIYEGTEHDEDLYNSLKTMTIMVNGEATC